MGRDSLAAGVCVVGSVNLDLVVRTERHPLPGETVLGSSYREHPGGKGLNQAVAVARAGVRTRIVAAVGDDEAGQRLKVVATAEGIDIDSVTVEEGTPTGRAVIVVDDGGENSIVVIPGSNSHCSAPDRVEHSVVLAQLEVPLAVIDATFTEAKRVGAITILNPAPAQQLPASLLECCDIVVPNEHEVELLGGVDHLHSAGVETVIVTLGADGVLVSSAGSTRRLQAHPVEPVDTTGAGDSFCGSLAAGIASGLNLFEAIDRAIVAGALATTRHGAVPSIPTAADVDAVVNARS